MPANNDFYNSGQNFRMHPDDVIDVTPEHESLGDEMEYLSRLYADDGTPVIEKILVSHPFVRIVKFEQQRKGFWEMLLDALKI
jgi:hypothetical protein